MTDDAMANADPMDDPDRCTATARSTGDRCKNPAIPGSNVCRIHGGSADQVEKKAQERLDEMADSVTAELQDELAEAFDRLRNAEENDEYTKILREIRKLSMDILDRTDNGPSETTKVEGSDGGPLDVTVTREVVDSGDE
jgi:hypothetical protein